VLAAVAGLQLMPEKPTRCSASRRLPGLRQLSSEQILAADVVRIAETITMAITLFLELWALLPNVPQPDADELRRWRTTMLDEARKLGAPIQAASQTD